MGLGDKLTSAARAKVDEVSNAVTSKFKVPSTTKEQKKEANGIQKDELVRNQNVFLTEGFAKHPIVKKPEQTSADFYRFGNNLSRQAEGSGALDIGADLPKMIDDFVDASGNEELASIRVLGPPKGNAANGERQDLIPPYSKFILENVQEAHSERSQIVETFGDFWAFFFGERPPVYNFSGTLINTKNINWLADFMFYYENFLRGTRCVENNATLILTYGGRQIEGFMLNTSNATAAAVDKGVQISFQVLVIDRKILSLSVDFGLVIKDGKFAQDEAFLKKLTESGLSRAEVSRAYNTVKKVADGDAAAVSGNKTPASEAKSIVDEFKTNVTKTATGGLKKLNPFG